MLEAAGRRVDIPPRPLCCGRPLYDYGMLDLARRMLLQILETLRPAIREGVPVVGLEPSCVAVFRDEMTNLLPDDLDAQRLKGQTFVLGEFLDRIGWQPPRLPGCALVHGHGHHRSVLDFPAEQRLLGKVGLDVEMPDSGCCGMAGSFGFERQHYAISMKAAERVLLPAVRRAPADALIITDGFSCREQISQATGRRALHLAEVLRLALRGDRGGGPVRASAAPRASSHRRAALVTAAGAGLALTLLMTHGAPMRTGRR